MWCPLPWTHLGVKNNGTLRMCSHSQSAGLGNTVLHHEGKPLTIEDMATIDILNCDTLKQVRKDMLTGEYPVQCNRCKFEKNAGHRSRDEWETLRHINSYTKEMAMSSTLEDGTVIDPQLQDMDLRVGNECNLRCVMCFPGEAKKWYKDYEKIMGESHFNVDGKTYNLVASEGDFDWVRSQEKVSYLLKNSNNLLKIKFGGGEPLIIKHHEQLIEGLIENGCSQDIELEYSSNITVFPERLFELWKKFKLIKICASLDGIGEVNEAIRYPTKWNIVTENLKMLDDTDSNIEVFTSTTVSLLNIDHYCDLLLWLENQNFRKINKKAYKLSASHPVYNPKYLSISILDEHNAKLLFDSLYTRYRENKQIYEKVEFYHKFYELTKIENPKEFRKQFCERFYRFAETQNQNWDNIFPFAKNLIMSWQ